MLLMLFLFSNDFMLLLLLLLLLNDDELVLLVAVVAAAHPCTAAPCLLLPGRCRCCPAVIYTIFCHRPLLIGGFEPELSLARGPPVLHILGKTARSHACTLPQPMPYP